MFFLNVMSVDELQSLLVNNALIYPYNKWLVEEQVFGTEIRAYVVNKKFVCATGRIKASVIGNGISTLRELILDYNNLRYSNPHTSSRLVNLNNAAMALARQNLTLDDIPFFKQRVFVSEGANFSSGGESVDYTDIVPQYVKDLCVAAVSSVKGLFSAGVDIIYDEINNKAHVLELNSKAHLGSHVFPMNGLSRDPCGAIVEEYFPHNKHILTLFEVLDFNHILSQFSDTNINSVSLKVKDGQVAMEVFPK